MQNDDRAHRLVSVKEAVKLTSLSRGTIWLKIKAGKFPKPVKLGEGSRIAFLENEIQDWISAHVAARDGGRANA